MVTTTMTNVGVDLDAFPHALQPSVDLFHKLTEDILVRTKIPAYRRYGRAPFRNAGQVRNRGSRDRGRLARQDRQGSGICRVGQPFPCHKVSNIANVPAYSGQRILLEGYGIWDYYVRARWKAMPRWRGPTMLRHALPRRRVSRPLTYKHQQQKEARKRARG